MYILIFLGKEPFFFGHFRSSHMPSANSVDAELLILLHDALLVESWPLLLVLMMMKVLELAMVGPKLEAFLSMMKSPSTAQLGLMLLLLPRAGILFLRLCPA